MSFTAGPLLPVAIAGSALLLASQAIPTVVTQSGGSVKSLGKTTYVSSKQGGRYKVQTVYKNKEEAAEKMHNVDKIANIMKNYLLANYPNDPRTKRFIKNYRPGNLQEGRPDPENDYTSYSISKGDKLVMCLRHADDENKLHDQNTLNFVTIHELAHLASAKYGHGTEFVKNFVWMLKHAMKLKLYKYVDYAKHPINYCGMELDATPLSGPSV